MSKQTIVNLTKENRPALKKHALRTLCGLEQSLKALKANLDHHNDEVSDGAIVVTAAIAMAVEEAIKQATDELKKEKAH